jgi:hypothetical protein
VVHISFTTVIGLQKLRTTELDKWCTHACTESFSYGREERLVETIEIEKANSTLISTRLIDVQIDYVVSQLIRGLVN